MDRTLISGTTHRIPDSAVQGLKETMRRGNQCFLSTGRSYPMALEYEDQIEIPGVIFANGGGIAIGGRIMETHDIPDDLVKQMTDLCEALGGGYQIIGVHHAWQNPSELQRFRNRFPQEYPGIPEKEVFRRKGIRPVSEYDGEPIQKIDIFFANELTADVYFSRVPDSLNLVLSGGYYAGMGRRGGELTAKGISKGSAVTDVLNHFHVSKEDAYGFGDSMNDMEMMEACGYSIAMGNAAPEVKNISNYITDDFDHDGIYNALKHFELI